VASVESRPQWVIARAAWVLLGVAAVLTSVACGDQGFFPTTVDPGVDFGVADIVFDQNYFYCKVEPVLFANSCGSGDPKKGDASGGCHYSATAYRLTDYMPHVGDTCNGGTSPGVSNFPDAAKHNYQTSQARMKRDPDLAPLLQRPTQNQVHPREIIDIDSMDPATRMRALADADAIRQWATQFSSQ
jgi:hypothetical protein